MHSQPYPGILATPGTRHGSTPGVDAPKSRAVPCSARRLPRLRSSALSACDIDGASAWSRCLLITHANGHGLLFRWAKHSADGIASDLAQAQTLHRDSGGQPPITTYTTSSSLSP